MFVLLEREQADGEAGRQDRLYHRAARGQGRSYAVRLAEEGADIIGIDLCGQISSVDYPMPDEEDIEATVKLVEASGRRMFGAVADVRDETSLRAALNEGVTALERLDIVVANAGISSYAVRPRTLTVSAGPTSSTST